MLVLDYARNSSIRTRMTLSEEEKAELPRELFALANRRAEFAIEKAIEGEARNVPWERMSALSAGLHEVGQDLKVIADAIAVLAEYGVRA